jgi:hypothetical protein
MRIHLSRQVVQLLRRLGEEGTELRQSVESLRKDPTPKDALFSPERPELYQIFRAGYWLICEIDRSGSETVVRVAVIERN